MANKKEIIINWDLLNRPEYVILDLETTGFSAKTMAKIIEIGAIKVKNGKIVEEFSTFVNPEVNIKQEISDITHITNEMVKNAPTIDRVLPSFRKFIGNALIIAHNAVFDWNRFLLPNFKDMCIFPKNEVIDTMDISKITFTEKGTKHNLADLCERLNVETDGHHRAINDVKMTYKVLLKLIEINKDKIPNESVNYTQDLETDNFTGKIVKVNTWIKETKTGKITHSRQYVTLSTGKVYGSIFFDNLTKRWHNKDFDKEINLNQVQEKVLNFLNLKTIEDLCVYKNN